MLNPNQYEYGYRLMWKVLDMTKDREKVKRAFEEVFVNNKSDFADGMRQGLENHLSPSEFKIVTMSHYGVKTNVRCQNEQENLYKLGCETMNNIIIHNGFDEIKRKHKRIVALISNEEFIKGVNDSYCTYVKFRENNNLSV